MASALVLSVLPSLMAQTHWFRHLGGDSWSGKQTVKDVAADADGNVYVVGSYSDIMCWYVGSPSGNLFEDFYESPLYNFGGDDAFVMKMSGAGDLIWMERAGGYLNDEGLSIDVSENGTLAIVGTFIGSAEVFGYPLESNNTTVDGFVALLNTDDGSGIWVHQYGGVEGVDKGLGVSIAPNGSVAVVGEFMGEASWGTSVLTSMVDPITMTYSTDAFVASYSASGSLLWVKKGSAEYTDRAVSVTHGPGNEVYALGQFSDTITFDQTHNNPFYSAIFLIRYGTNGTEEWFRRAGGGAMDRGYEVKYTPQGDLAVCGGMGAAMSFAGPTEQLLTSNAPHAAFVWRVALDGTLTQYATLPSFSSAAARALAIQGDTLALYGDFKCQFQALADHYNGDGLFMAAGFADLFICRMTYSDLGLVDAHHFPGRSAPRTGGVEFLPDGHLVFGGTIDSWLVLPTSDLWNSAEQNLDTVNWEPHVYWPGGELYCGDSAYTSGVPLRVQDFDGEYIDGFVTKGYDRTRRPWDIWDRLNDTLDCAFDAPPLDRPLRVNVDGAIVEVADLDTVSGCSVTPIQFSLPLGYSGPDLLYQTQIHAFPYDFNAPFSGWVNYTIGFQNGCWSYSSDSIYVIRYGRERPSFTAQPSVAVSIPQNPSDTASAYSCVPFWLWVNNPPDGGSVVWTMDTIIVIGGVAMDSSIVIATGDSLFIQASGPQVLAVTYTTSDGCTWRSYIEVGMYMSLYSALPNITGYDLTLFMGNDTLIQDTVVSCGNTLVNWRLHWYIDGVLQLAPANLRLLVSSGFENLFFPSDQNSGSIIIPLIAGQWAQFTIGVTLSSITTPCEEGEQFVIEVTDSLFLLQPQPFLLDLDVPEGLCTQQPGIIVINCDQCDSLTVYGAGIDSLSAGFDTVWVNGPGLRYIQVFSVNGEVPCDSIFQFTVPGPDPLTAILMDPFDGLFCPGYSVILSTSISDAVHTWTGPNGILPETGSEILTGTPGDYSVFLIDPNGCSLELGPVSVNFVPPPFLEVLPLAALCPGEEVTLQVLAGLVDAVSWGPPLSGSAFSQVVDVGGVYTCEIIQCGTVYQRSVTIFQGDANAGFTSPGPYTICPGDSLLLIATPGQAGYLWTDLDLFEPALWVTEEGTLELITFDSFGCVDTAFATVRTPFDIPLSTSNAALCAGQSVLLNATGSAMINWYSDQALSQLVHTGNSFTITPTATTTYYVVQTEDGCVGEPQAVVVTVNPSVGTISVDGPTAACIGDQITLSVQVPALGTVEWSWPNGTTTTSESILLDPVDSTDAGVYEVLVTLANCGTDTIFHTLAVFGPTPPFLGPDTVICDGETLLLQLPSVYSEVAWSTGQVGNSIMAQQPGTYVATATDVNGCSVEATVVVGFIPCNEEGTNTIIPNVITPNGDGRNDTWTYFAEKGDRVQVTIFNRWGQTLFQMEAAVVTWDGYTMSGQAVMDGTYFFIAETRSATNAVSSGSGYITVTGSSAR